MNRSPKSGDVVRIINCKGEHLVVASSTWWFDAVAVKNANALTGAIDGSKTRRYWTVQAGVPDKAIVVLPSEVHLVGTAKFKTKTTVEYTITKMKEA